MINNFLNKKLISLGILATKTLSLAVQSVENRDSKLANEVDEKNDLMERLAFDLEESCLKILALHQPVANDLRFVITVLKVNNDLKQIGELINRIAIDGKSISRDKKVEIPIELLSLSKKVEKMVDDCIFCFVQANLNSAKKICMADYQVNFIHKQSFEKVKKAILRDIANFDSYHHCLSISKHLERIGDLATNIAEDLCFMIGGKIIRHQNLDYIEVGV